ncbi:MAG: hypothetical protein R2877_01725 [Bdellovibrionota bacterium]
MILYNFYSVSLDAMTNILWIIIFALIPGASSRQMTLETLSDALLQEFYSKKQKPKDVFTFEKKDTDDLSRGKHDVLHGGSSLQTRQVFGDGT